MHHFFSTPAVAPLPAPRSTFMSIPTGSEPPRSVFHRLLKPVFNRLKAIAASGLSPRALLKTLCIGAAMGVLPLVWGTALLCLWLANRFRLNHLVLQSVNYLLYPLQLALLIPFCKLGLALVPWGPSISPDQLANLPHTGISNTFSLFLWLSFKALIAWLITVPPLALLIYLALLATVLKRSESAPVVVT